jgi:hypothetical protein
MRILGIIGLKIITIYYLLLPIKKGLNSGIKPISTNMMDNRQ